MISFRTKESTTGPAHLARSIKSKRRLVSRHLRNLMGISCPPFFLNSVFLSKCAKNDTVDASTLLLSPVQNICLFTRSC